MTTGSLAADLVAQLTARGETLACAESLTGGLVSGAVTEVPGSSAVLVGGVVAYATPVKAAMLRVPADILASAGAVSAECATAMALGARDLFGTDWAVSTTGVAGPDEQEGKPAGRAFVAVAGRGTAAVQRLDLTGSRAEIRAATVDAALRALARALAEASPGTA